MEGKRGGERGREKGRERGKGGEREREREGKVAIAEVSSMVVEQWNYSGRGE